MTGIQPNSMYLLYYMAANEYPFRPIMAYTVYHDSIVTMSWGYLLTIKELFVVLTFLMLILS